MNKQYFYVFELQSDEVGSTLSYVYDNRADAEEKYHQIMMYAAKSNLRKHGAALIHEDGYVLKSEVYRYEDMHQDEEE